MEDPEGGYEVESSDDEVLECVGHAVSDSGNAEQETSVEGNEEEKEEQSQRQEEESEDSS